jgi:hypothetical protein
VILISVLQLGQTIRGPVIRGSFEAQACVPDSRPMLKHIGALGLCMTVSPQPTVVSPGGGLNSF